jgi:hypothetical protein
MLKLGVSMLVALAMSTAAQAAYINGYLDFGLGSLVLKDSAGNTTSNFNAVRGIAFNGTTKVNVAGGDFAGVLGSTVAFNQNPWVFDPVSTGDLWNVGGFTFNVQSATYAVQTLNNTSSLVVVGTGFVKGNSFKDTAGTWVLTTQRSNLGTGANRTELSWSSSASSEGGRDVPDGGTTLAMFGVTLLGLCGARALRKR